ncbi:MAG: dihydroorotase family protein [Granulosicoccus sp.]
MTQDIETPMTGKRHRIKGGLLPGASAPQDILVSGDTITDIVATGKDNSEQNVFEIDASNCLVFPGLFDLYSRCREPGLTRKGNIASESIAALAAGFTHVLCSPDTLPAVDNVATVELITHRSEQVLTGASVIPMAALTVGLRGEQLSELATLQAAGCPVASQADQPIDSTNVLYSAMEYASSFNMPLLLNARDAQLGIGGCAHTGAVATQLGLPTIPIAAETVALARMIELCRETGCRLHISRISSARAVEHINDAKQEGLPISCDVGIHHLFFIDELLAGYDASFHSAVPFRGRDDRQALRNGLKSGVIDAICSDHAPHDVDASLAPFPVTEPGLAAYDWFIPLLLQVPEVTGLSLEQVIHKLHDAPQKILWEHSEATLNAGSPASFFVVNIEAPFEKNMANMLSAGINHPLAIHDADTLGLSPLKGHVKTVFHQGRSTNFINTAM